MPSQVLANIWQSGCPPCLANAVDVWFQAATEPTREFADGHRGDGVRGSTTGETERWIGFRRRWIKWIRSWIRWIRWRRIVVKVDKVQVEKVDTLDTVDMADTVDKVDKEDKTTQVDKVWIS